MEVLEGYEMAVLEVTGYEFKESLWVKSNRSLKS